MNSNTQAPIMMLSAAIRQGSKKIPQAIRNFFNYDEHGNAIAACALGAAYFEVTQDTGSHHNRHNDAFIEEAILEHWPWLRHTFIYHINGTVSPMYRIVALANDKPLSRETIAAWIELAEATLASKIRPQSEVR